jgi:hypothetical protein
VRFKNDGNDGIANYFFEVYDFMKIDATSEKRLIERLSSDLVKYKVIECISKSKERINFVRRSSSGIFEYASNCLLDTSSHFYDSGIYDSKNYVLAMDYRDYDRLLDKRNFTAIVKSIFEKIVPIDLSDIHNDALSDIIFVYDIEKNKIVKITRLYERYYFT